MLLELQTKPLKCPAVGTEGSFTHATDTGEQHCAYRKWERGVTAAALCVPRAYCVHGPKRLSQEEQKPDGDSEGLPVVSIPASTTMSTTPS